MSKLINTFFMKSDPFTIHNKKAVLDFSKTAELPMVFIFLK